MLRPFAEQIRRLRCANISAGDFFGITGFGPAKTLGVKVGDTITWHIFGNGEWVKTAITAIYRTPVGQGLAIASSVFEELGFGFEDMPPTAILTAMKVDATEADSGPEALSGFTAALSIDSLADSYKEFTELMVIMTAVLILGAALLGLVVLYNLGLLSFIERQRELATLKVLGFRTIKIRSLLIAQNFWLTWVGIAIGIPLGYLLIGFIMRTMPENMDVIAVIKPLTMLIGTIGTFLVSYLVSLMFSKQVQRLDMVGSLKGVE